LPLSVLYDDKGKPLMTADGKGYQTDGSISRFLSAAVQFDTMGGIRATNQLIEHAKSLSGEQGEELLAEAERMKEAMVMVQEFRDSGGKLPSQREGQNANANAIPPHVKARMEQLERENAAAKEVGAKGEAAASEAFQSAVETEFNSSGTSYVESVLTKTSLNDNERGFIAEKAITKALAAMADNGIYQTHKNRLYSQGRSDDNRKAIVALATRAFRTAVDPVLKTLIEKAGGKAVSRQKERLDKIDQQTQKDTMNRGSSATASGKAATPASADELRSKAIENYKSTHGGDTPTDGEILKEVLKLGGGF
jgi:hypothetical protein